MLTKPRTVCACQLVDFIISANVAPLARFIIAMTSAFLLVPSDFGLPAAFFAPLAFLAALRRTLGCASVTGLLMFSESIVLIVFSFDRFAVVTFITRVGRNSKSIVRRL